MKRTISILVIATLLLASVLAMIPASAATPEEYNLMGNSNADKQFAGESNVFYFDIHRYEALGNTFPMSDKGNSDYMIRYPNAGSGSASVSDGTKTSAAFSHDPDDGEATRVIGDKKYHQIFGYSFKESVVADEITIYFPADTPIASLDVYGASYTAPANGVADQAYIDNLTNFAKEAPKTALAEFATVAGTAATTIDGTQVIVLTATLNEAFKMDYLIFGVVTSNDYKIYEIELNGILAKDAADFSALKTQIAAYKALNEADWTEESWASLETVFASADAVNKNATSTADEIANAATTLQEAISALKAKPADKTTLAAKITEAAALVEADYTPATWEAFQTALTAANAANDAESISQTEVNNALANLDAAIKALKAPADKTDLATLITTVASYNEADYTPNTWAALKVACEDAEEVFANVSATQEEVDDANGKLNMAINALAKPGNKTALTAAITSAKALKQADYQVTALTWSVFQNIIGDAEAVVNDPNATQGEVDLALSNLNEKIESLGKPVTDDDNGNTDDAGDADNAGDSEGGEDAGDAETEAPATDAPATDAPATDAPAAKGGCGSSIAVSALAIVAVAGTAVVLKKKEN